MSKKKSKGKNDVVVASPWHISAGDQDTKTFLAATGSDSVDDAAGPSVWLESQRTNFFEGLKVQLRRECTSEGQSRYPSMAFERWWLSAKDLASGGLDPLLPTPKVAEDPALVSDLERSGFSRKAASEIARRLASSSEAAAVAIQRTAAKKSSMDVVEMQRSEEGDEVLLLCKSAGARVRVSGFAYKKLKKLYEFHGVQSCPFEKAVMVLGMRYLALGGTGFQLALPSAAWRVLQEDFAVQAECFASPLNCWFPNYCSAFPDCDRCFGSMGSFSSFNPRRGCFEANPPFAPAVIAGMKKHMHSLLAATEEPLSFVIAIASWENPEVAALRKSPFARGHILVPRDEQVWLDGLQSRRAPVELLIVVLQNDAAASDEKMMISREKLERLRQSCTGEAKPLGPRKRPRLDTSVETAQAAADGQGETLDAEASADRARAISIRPGGVLWRVPHWQLVKLKRFCSWFRLKAAAKSFGWTSSVTDGWHARNMRFWLKEAATVDGMTGGGVSDKDLVFNQQFMRKLARLRGNSKGRFQRALDVGAGIGRLAKGVFRTHCDHVDLLEPIEKHLQVARKDLDDTTWPGHFICGTLQDFQQPQQSLYDLVWCQWIFMYITDADVVKFLRRVSVELLAPAGTVVVKENVAQTRVGSYFDDETGELWRGANGGSRHSGPMSVLRTPQHYLKLFRESGLEVLLRRRQLFSQDEMPMTLFVLAAPSRSETVRRAAAAARAMREARHGTSDRALDGKTTREVQTRGCLPNLLRAPASRAKDVSQWGVRYPDASQRVHSPACPAMHDGMS
ncbi:pcif1 [Symbiodinium microadriaticum]|nr:pcif1 [Symbiodinium microadriaticum]